MTSAAECNEIVQNLLESDESFKNLLSVGQKNSWSVICRSCGTFGVERHARAFITKHRSIVLCTNRLSKRAVKEALTHEGIHAYDMDHSGVDFNSCHGIAYSEVRAARGAECAGQYPFEWAKEKCIKTKAMNSTKIFHPLQYEECVEKVFREAMADERP